jgi:hypothetical protein
VSWFSAWFGYGVGREVARAVLGESRSEGARPPIVPKTEAEIRADERRYDEDAKRLEAEDAAARVRAAH